MRYLQAIACSPFALPGRGGCLITPGGGVEAAAPTIFLNNLKS